jgi:hypothetical protein
MLSVVVEESTNVVWKVVNHCKYVSSDWTVIIYIFYVLFLAIITN